MKEKAQAHSVSLRLTPPPQGEELDSAPPHCAHQIAQLAAPIRPSSITNA